MEEQNTLVPIEKKDTVGRDIYRKTAKPGRQVYQVLYDKISTRKNFDKRMQLGDLDELADSILGSGLIDPIIVDAMADGTFQLVDGHRRYRAHGILQERGIPGFEKIECFVLPSGTADFTRYAIMVARNQMGKDLEPLELGNVFKQMLLVKTPDGKEVKAADIARATGYSKMHVSNMLRLSGIDEEIKNAVKEGKLSETTALEMDKKGLSTTQQLDKIAEAEAEGKKLQVKDVKEGNTKQPAIDGWEKVKGEEIVVSKKELRKHVGRIYSMPVYRGWTEDFIDEDTGETVPIERREVLFPEGKIFEADHIEILIEEGIKIVRFEKLKTEIPDTKPLGVDEVMKDESNAEADHQELQEAGLFGKNDKPRSTTLIDLSIETSIMLKSLWHHLSNIEKRLGSDHLEDLDLAKEMATKLGVHVGQIKVIAENLKA